MELNDLITNQVEESLHLDYKESRTFTKGLDAIRKDLAKDVSAFANSDGGMVIYGVIEQGRRPTALDGGIDHQEWPAERLENIITANVAPRLNKLDIVQISASDTHSYYVIEVGKSFRGPHQSSVEKRYFKRWNFKAEPMEDYEVRDVMNRRDLVSPLVTVDIDIRWGVIVDLVIRNIGDIPAEDVRFVISPPLEKLAKAKLLTDGTLFLPPGKIFRYAIGSAQKHVTKDDALHFEVEASYVNRHVPTRVVEKFRFDLSDYFWSAIVDSDVERLSSKLVETLNKLIGELAKTNKQLDAMSTIAGGTGLDVSVRTLRNFAALQSGGSIERLAAHGLPWTAFAEVLGIDYQTAISLSLFAEYGEGKLEDVSDLAPEVIAKAREYFIFDEDNSSG